MKEKAKACFGRFAKVIKQLKITEEKCFEMFDIDQDGFISTQEFREVCQ